ncbi:MAG TPA: response regulator transcription factor [Gemmatimonadaceae bacterium]|nr:response regulator transcription factor [Gemmatimonadaceae bacterium]
MRLLLAEDDPQLGPTLVRGLREHAWAVDLAADGEQARYLAAINEYDLIVLDVMLPIHSGLDVCRGLREKGSRIPVLMLTARDTVTDKIVGLNAGADDYLTKPFSFDELVARLRALMRRGPQTASEVLTVADLVVDTRAQGASRGGRTLSLTTKEYAMLEYMARNAGRVLGRADLCAHVWDDNHDPMSNSLEVYVSRLRRKIDAPGEQPLIHTRRGAGYMLGVVSEPGKRSGTRS